ncbi:MULTISPECIES: envelope integrity protein Cei [unclassified Amycolatopsis]|uniref:envelope integrity protein Cei n=1 Tax=unclassified Amycolatopsis TaxID=2618356 RepID=UPI001FF1FACC|nr:MULTISPECIES: envelope integrity protein Cei [unclassified Amycolatopsis]UOZ02389.1 envelope integrity protein Cei [Amycolatopsis sp. WQ 127309]WSJ77865.1 envelope integrity protein Cei [Amycolatopsis sp. NBC_01307]WSK78560.1 envelope integrity protein Cei [Amycolatopsis sp. NBC_01286]
MASGNGIGDRAARPYRRHKPLPALIVIGVLALGAIIVWINAAVGKGDVDEAVRCDPQASPPPGVTFSTLPHNALDDRAPVPPDKVAVKVLNASSTRGQGSITTTALHELGFTNTGEPANDPAYENREAKCRGQIRFGENGITAARTLGLVVPCAELVQDNRKDASVDLVTGTNFGDIRPRAEARQVLTQLAEWSKAHQGGGGNEQSAGAQAPVIDQTLLASARDVQC